LTNLREFADGAVPLGKASGSSLTAGRIYGSRRPVLYS
jgi:hypothetical protein